jgi:hypothetical protein
LGFLDALDDPGFLDNAAEHAGRVGILASGGKREWTAEDSGFVDRIGILACEVLTLS